MEMDKNQKVLEMEELVVERKTKFYQLKLEARLIRKREERKELLRDFYQTKMMCRKLLGHQIKRKEKNEKKWQISSKTMAPNMDIQRHILLEVVS